MTNSEEGQVLSETPSVDDWDSRYLIAEIPDIAGDRMLLTDRDAETKTIQLCYASKADIFNLEQEGDLVLVAMYLQRIAAYGNDISKGMAVKALQVLERNEEQNAT